MQTFGKSIRCAGGLGLALLFSASAAGMTQEITARFRPDPGNPMVNKFENTTPISSICSDHIPARCKALNIFSLRENAFEAFANAPIEANHESERQGFMVKVPSTWRPLDVVHTKTGETKRVEMRVAGVGGLWFIPRFPGVSAWLQPGVSYWGSQWRNAPSPCQSTNHLAAGVNFASFFWLTPDGAGPCSRKPSETLTTLRFATLEYAYELKTPDPLGMSTGQYVGSITYSVGPGGDYDFGDVIIPTDNSITFNFTLDVEHALKVEIPPGGHRIELLPQGGWQAWLNQGRKPVRLFRDQTFNVSASSRFKMQLECQYATSNTCALRDAESGRFVPLNISVSLPHGLGDASGAPVSRQPLLLDGSGTELFQPTFYVDRKPGTLHFEITKENVDQMLEEGVAKTYSGAVTVIWDSEI